MRAVVFLAVLAATLPMLPGCDLGNRSANVDAVGANSDPHRRRKRKHSALGYLTPNQFETQSKKPN